MLEQRFREEVTQTEKEMITFIENVCKVRGDLEKDILKIKEQSMFELIIILLCC